MRFNITGKRFGKLVAIAPIKTSNGVSQWLCRCDCGNVSTPRLYSLLKRGTISCGCAKIKYGNNVRIRDSYLFKTYTSWAQMKSRCDNPNIREYYLYGGRGIKYCKKWSKFDSFLKDMGIRPPETTLDRINNYKGYSKSNCRWATHKEQYFNKRCFKRKRCPYGHKYVEKPYNKKYCKKCASRASLKYYYSRKLE